MKCSGPFPSIWFFAHHFVRAVVPAGPRDPSLHSFHSRTKRSGFPTRARRPPFIAVGVPFPREWRWTKLVGTATLLVGRSHGDQKPGVTHHAASSRSSSAPENFAHPNSWGGDDRLVFAGQGLEFLVISRVTLVFRVPKIINAPRCRRLVPKNNLNGPFGSNAGARAAFLHAATARTHKTSTPASRRNFCRLHSMPKGDFIVCALAEVSPSVANRSD